MKEYNVDVLLCEVELSILAILRGSNTRMILSELESWLTEFSQDKVWQLYRGFIEKKVSSEILQGILRRSYRHGNGFCKVVLVERPEFKCRLHVWEGGNTGVEALHNHRWGFASSLQAGEIHADIFDDSVKVGAQPFKEFVYQREATEKSSLVRIGVSNMEKVTEHRYGVGDTYTMDCNTIHRITHVGKPLTATLFIQLHANRSWNRLLLQEQQSQPSMQRPALSRAKLVDLFKKVLAS